VFQAAWQDYRKRHVTAKLKASTARECERLFDREILPRWRNRRLNEISKQDVLDLLDEIVDRGAPTTANHAFAWLRHFFNWALGRNLLAVSPCAGVKKPSKPESRRRWLSDDEIHWLWQACDGAGFPFGYLTKLLLLTGARREEVRAMCDRELRLSQRTWTIPPARTKNGEAHEIALADATLAVIEAVPRVRNKAGYLFCTNGSTPVSGFTRAKRSLDKGMLECAQKEARERGAGPADVQIEPWVLHDLRRTVASGMARLGVALPVVEKCLNHVSGSFGGIVGVYQQHDFKDEKRAAFEAWAQHVEAVVSGRPAANVIPLRA
jgi:integrase